MTPDNDSAPRPVVRPRQTGVNGLPDDLIQNANVSETFDDGATGSGDLFAGRDREAPRNASTPSYVAWVAVGAVISGAAGALVGWTRGHRRYEKLRTPRMSTTGGPSGLTPPHGDKLLARRVDTP
jgi:hypothetical protein